VRDVESAISSPSNLVANGTDNDIYYENEARPMNDNEHDESEYRNNNNKHYEMLLALTVTTLVDNGTGVNKLTKLTIITMVLRNVVYDV
jgi:hypothetical protein